MLTFLVFTSHIWFSIVSRKPPVLLFSFQTFIEVRLSHCQREASDLTTPFFRDSAPPADANNTTMFLSWWQWLVSFFYRIPTKHLLTPSTMSGIKKWSVKEAWLNTHCELGEGPYYEPATNTLRFVDIKKKQLHTVNLADGPKSLKTLQFDMPVGVTADIEGVDPTEKLLIGGKSGIYLLERKTGKVELLKKFYDTEEKDERLRSNDGAVDPQGRFWVGTMSDFWLGDFYPEGEHFSSPSFNSCRAIFDRALLLQSLSGVIRFVIPNSRKSNKRL